MMSKSVPQNRNIAVWMSDKKSQKTNWNALFQACISHGYNLIKVDLERPFEEQGQFDVFLHKLTDIIAAADQGDVKASSIINHIEQYLSNHPNVTVIDPLDNVRILLNRQKYYKILQDEPTFYQQRIFTPNFVEFTTEDLDINLRLMKEKDVKFPVICKPTLAHGSKLAHEMVLIFNEKGLRVCKPPCVLQSFVNHNAVLHKVFLIGNRYHICRRPSLKNFYNAEDFEPIFYSTGEVCKADSQSTLSILDPDDQTDIKICLDESKIRHIIKVLTNKIGLLLAGFDVVIENETGNHAIIDINVYPSYDNFPNFFDHLIECIDETVNRNLEKTECRNCLNIDNESNQRRNGLINVAFGCINGVSDINTV